MKSGFVNLNRVRQQQAAEAARLEAERAQQATASAAPSTPPSAPPLNTPSTSSTSLSPPNTHVHGTSPPSSPFRAPPVGSSLLVRRHNTVGGKPQRTLSATQRRRVDEEPEDDREGDDSFDADSASVTTEESAHVHTNVGAGLTRHGSLPSRTAPYPISPVQAGFPSSSRPRFGTHRSSGAGPTQYDSIASVSGQTADEPAYGAEDDEEWERALAERRRNGGAAEDEHFDDPNSGPGLSSSAPKGNSLHHQRSLPHYRSLNFNSPSASAGARSPPLLSPNYYGGLGPSASGSLVRAGSSHDGHSHQRSSTTDALDESPYMPNSGVRRHQSLTQPGVHARAADRQNRSQFPDARSRNASEEADLGGGGPSSWRRNDLPPPTSPIRGSPWDAPQQDLLARQRSWDDEQQQSTTGPLSPVPGSGSRWRRDGSGGTSDEGAMSAEQLQNAFDAISLGRSMASSTSALQPPVRLDQAGNSGASSPDPHTHHSRTGSASTHQSLHPNPSLDRSRHSRSPSQNPPPPRFASPSPGPSDRDGGPAGSRPHGNEAALPKRPAVVVPSFPHGPSPGGSSNPSPSPSGTIKLSLLTDPTTLGQGSTTKRPYAGPQTAAAYVPPVGHSTQPPLSSGGYPGPGAGPGGFGGPLAGAMGMGGGGGGGGPYGGSKPFTAMGTGWEQKSAILGARPTAGPNPMYGGQPGGPAFGRGPGAFGGPLGGQQPFGLSPMQQSFGQQANFLVSSPGVYGVDPSVAAALLGGGSSLGGAGGLGSGLASPVDVPTLTQLKGYNPTTFDTSPPRARFFVIKSYTEDDVAKSLKFEIWSSTTFGNKRLDKAFKESAAVMPIYLFFSVNSSGHFAGVAQMLTEVDYNTTSTVWAQDKWKGVFRLRWIFIKDVPNQALRHIRLNNTQERKPVTNSRDTQELLPEAGIEMLKIFHSYQSRTSLLQDYAFYDLQSAQKDLATQVEAARQPVAHLPPFPAQPTYATTQPQTPGYASSVVYQQQGQQQQQQQRY